MYRYTAGSPEGGAGAASSGRADVGELLYDIGRLPTEQREALVLSQVSGMSGREVANVLDCSPERIRALVFQARTALGADRTARTLACPEVREACVAARGPLKRHGLDLDH